MFSLHRSFTERSLSGLQRELAQTQEKVATGQRINRPSDNPDDYAQVNALKAFKSRQTQHQKNIDHARNWLHQSEDKLQNIAELVQEGRQTGLQAANLDPGAKEWQLMANKVDNLISDVTQQVNAQHNSTGEYLFAGTKSNGPAVAYNSGTKTYSYKGNSSPQERRILNDLKAPVSVTGDRILSAGGAGKNLFGRLQDLKKALSKGDKPALQKAIGALGKAHNDIVNLTAEVGTYSNRLSNAEDQLQETIHSTEQWRSEIEDTDFTKALSQLQRLQTGYQASLKTVSSILQKSSLVNYL